MISRKFRITYEFVGFVSADIVEASSKYNAKQKFYNKYPRAAILKVEPVGKEFDAEDENES